MDILKFKKKKKINGKLFVLLDFSRFFEYIYVSFMATDI